MSPQDDSTDEFRKHGSHFSRESLMYDNAKSESGMWKWWRRKELGAIMDILKPCPGELILDAGCGAGHYAEVLKESGAEVIAVDLSLPFARGVNRRLKIPTVVTSLEQLGLRWSFEAVLCAGALEFYPHPARAVAQMGELLNEDDSRLVLMLPAEGPPGKLYKRYHEKNGMEVTLFTPRVIKGLADKAGLHLDGAHLIGFNYVVRMTRREITVT